ncbi:uncharacterized protein LOC117647887 [Thrips palmi]|uniref:Uncharacterized protein LOC117647887 n=1 Tax=Thrips palmi TaxID=161013 RepID=A0A6P8ZBZ9_THRPL|nr:uncharacterized protein LOC117647887 [Thrips palmi]
MDPMIVPECLKSLSYVEKQLIARVHPVVSLYKIKDCQYKYSGNVINFPQKVQCIADALPHNINDLSSIITIRLDNSEGHKDFLVRRKAVTEALVWLQKNNPFYKNVVINHQRCKDLPTCENVYHKMKGYTQAETSDNSESDSDVGNELIADKNDTINFTDVPDLNTFSQKEQLNNSFGEEIIKYPTIGKKPLSEFDSPGYFAMAFPHLFPYGKGDFTMPRAKKISFSDYVKHLMLYHDGRFAQDERFRYFLMNSQMRWQALNAGNIFTQNNKIFSDMTILQLKEYLKEHPNVVKNIIFYASRIRTTRPYWNSRCSELLEMHNQLGSPTVFLTLSSADYYWPDFFRLLGYNVLHLTMSERRKLLSENPLLFESFFVKRCTYFMEECVKHKFNVKDFWYRFEYQHRGSIHLHGLLWLSDSPSIDNVTVDKQKEVIDYFNSIISCNNPNVNFEVISGHPCERRLLEVINTDNDYINLVNTVQRHTQCKKGYCLKQKKGTLKCRFNFPFEMEEYTKLIMDGNPFKRNCVERNDP